MFNNFRQRILKKIRIPVHDDGTDYLFMKGYQNRGIRNFKYFQDGNSILSGIEGLIFKVSGVYFFLNLTNIWIAVIATVGWIILCVLAGWYNAHYMARVIEEINLKLSSHYSKKAYEISTEGVPDLLREISRKLDK